MINKNSFADAKIDKMITKKQTCVDEDNYGNLHLTILFILPKAAN